MPRQITLTDAVEVSRLAARDIENWLKGIAETRQIINVEDDPQYQIQDIDLIWQTQNREYKIEIKGDRWHKTGNFFFETHSNRERNTPGCFIYTHADYIFYYFVVPKILYCLPVPETRDWFLSNLNRFKERSTTTPTRTGSYTTVGRLVPIATLLKEVKGVKKVILK